MYIGFQIYPFMHMCKASGIDLDLESILTMCSGIGYTGWECFLDSSEVMDEKNDFIATSALDMKSAYINLVLHESDQTSSEVARAITLVEKHRHLGIQYLVVNPSPVSWTENVSKNDRQLACQLESFTALAGELDDIGVSLAYHTHSSEMRAGAKEQFYMLLNTDPDLVSWSIDCDWIYQGTDGSALAVYDWIAMFGDRVSIVHARQISGGVWNQRFEEGDIDYRKVIAMLNQKGRYPLIINEQIPGDPIDAYQHQRENYSESYKEILAAFSA